MRAASRARPGVQHDHLQTKHRQAGPNGKPWDSPTKIPQGVFKCTDQSKGDLPKNDMQSYCGKRLCCHLVCITVTLSNVFYPCFRSLRRRHRIAGKTSSLSPSGNVVMLTGEKRDLPWLGTSQTEPRGSNIYAFFLQERKVQKGRGGSGVFNGHSIASISHVVWRSAPRLEARVWCGRWHHQLQHSPNCPPQGQGQQQTSWWVNLITLPEEFLTSRLWYSGLIFKM